MKALLKATILCILYLSSSILHADEDIDKLLNDFNQKNDLSQKTIDQNKGHLFLFSRDRLEKMQATTLKDIFKALPVTHYNENRYGLPDPLTLGGFEPYRSNFLRLYVDGVEITQGWMGSGIMLYGDVNIGFVDHIECYMLATSFDTSVEPAYMTIFLYSKNPQYDSGGEVSLVEGSRGYNSQSINIGEQKNNFAYMVNFSHTNAKREKIDNGTNKPLSRDFERTQLFSYIKKEDQIFHLQVMKKKSDSLAGLSYDATPIKSEIDYLNIHMDYGIDLSEYWKAQFSYDWLQSDFRQEDDIPLAFFGMNFGDTFNGIYKNSTYTGELTYRNTIDNHRLITGVKGRFKKLDSFESEKYGEMPLTFTEESILTAFVQDQYMLSDNQLLTLGVNYSKIYRNSTVSNDDLLQLRLGYIFTNDEWTYKAYLYRIMFAINPYSRYLGVVDFDNVAPQITTGLTHEIGYSIDNYSFRFMFMAVEDKDEFIQNIGTENSKYYLNILNSEYIFNMDNKLYIQASYGHYTDVFYYDKLDDYSLYFSSVNSCESFDFYNGITWRYNTLDPVNYFDFTSSITWNVSENMTFVLKGQNILGKAKSTAIQRINPRTSTLLEPLYVSPIDKSITVEMEYTF